jgi:hypothetical protein
MMTEQTIALAAQLYAARVKEKESASAKKGAAKRALDDAEAFMSAAEEWRKTKKP